MTITIGLTGSIGMGKSTTAKMFTEYGVPVWDADAAVVELYGKKGAAVVPIEKLGKHLISAGTVSKSALKNEITKNPKFLEELEKVVHPLVAKHRQNFLDQETAPIVLLDIPLLFETGLDQSVDVTVCVTVDAETQKARVLQRGTMTEEQFNLIISKQLPSAEKCAKADFVVPTGTMDLARSAVKDILAQIEKGSFDA